MTPRLTATQRLTRLVEDAGGALDRGEAMRRLAPILGVRDTRSAVGLAIVTRQVALSDDDMLVLPEEQA